MPEAVRTCQRCGATLSRYNRDARCAPCSSADLSPGIPPGLWQLEPIRRALAMDDVGGVLVTARRTLGLTQGQLAELLTDKALAFSQAKISRIESGGPIRDMDDRRRISDVLGIPAELLGLASRRRHAKIALALRPVVMITDEEASTPMQRRSVLAGAAALIGSTLSGPLAEPANRRIGTAHVEQAEEALAQLWALDDRYGDDGIHELATGLLQRVHAMLNLGTYAEPIGARLHALAGRLAEHAGWLSFDTGRQDHARYFLTEALTSARISGDEELEVLVLGSLSVQAAHVSRHREAVALAQCAQDSSVARRLPTAYAMAAFREARAYALAQDNASANKAMLRAEKAFARAGSRPEWVAYLDEAELAAKFAFCWAALGRNDKAVVMFEQALAQQGDQYQRNRVLYSMYLARAYAAAGEAERAAAVGLSALGHAERVTSVRVLDEATRLRDQLAPLCVLGAAEQYSHEFDTRFPHLRAGTAD